jgi:hypothetical protein
MKFKPVFMRSCCPVCHTEDSVYIYDHDFLKYWSRLFAGNNRFACRNCRVTWRRNKPYGYVGFANRLMNKDGSGTPAPPGRKSHLTVRGLFPRNLVKNFWVYCIIVVFSVAIAYVLTGMVPVNFKKPAPRQRTVIQNTGNSANAGQLQRDDHKAGAQEMQAHGMVRKPRR